MAKSPAILDLGLQTPSLRGTGQVMLVKQSRSYLLHSAHFKGAVTVQLQIVIARQEQELTGIRAANFLRETRNVYFL